jgi:hypothetical protein
MDTNQLPSADPTALLQTLPPDAVASGGPFILWLFFWFAFIVTAGFAFSLFYHWLRFGYMYPLSFIAMPVYGVGVLLFIGAMLSGIATL